MSIRIRPIILKIILFIGAPLTFIASVWLKFIKRKGIGTVSDKIFMYVGFLPLIDHYYEPLINPKKYLKKSLSDDRNLPGFDLNSEEQLNLLNKFHYNDEILKFPLNKQKENEFYFNNRWYTSGDAEYLYNMIRHFKPKRLFEIGSGFSTMLARNAIIKNKLEDSDYICQHICIEPYECLWLEELKDVTVIRQQVQDVDKSFFQQLDNNDILFIDSSHVIRPQGDVLFEYLEILPVLKSGVIVHIHDIFTPKDYPDEWIFKHSMWNEQYLLEALLSNNPEFKIIGALNYLSHNYRNEFAGKCPFFANNQGYDKIKEEPRAFWIQKI